MGATLAPPWAFSINIGVVIVLLSSSIKGPVGASSSMANVRGYDVIFIELSELEEYDGYGRSRLKSLRRWFHLLLQEFHRLNLFRCLKNTVSLFDFESVLILWLIIDSDNSVVDCWNQTVDEDPDEVLRDSTNASEELHHEQVPQPLKNKIIDICEDEIPKKDMCFESCAEAHAFYRNYAFKGFSHLLILFLIPSLWSENLTYYTSVAYLSGVIADTATGTVEGLRAAERESAIQSFTDRDNMVNSAAAGLVNGALYQATAGPRSAAIAGVFGGITIWSEDLVGSF
ncbi:hypothetical protein PIB30_012627 [Stylosanthes scabra]|uniref:Uncharacterized protein n=1 Tax=Stylosanthes scabra TaxID=79078 RepID=A0ABU6Y4K5_9FABA|nr:hypothetical protein [Stylosanthes scabra]